MKKGKSEVGRRKSEVIAGKGVFRLGDFSLVRGKSGALWLWHEGAGGMVLDEEMVERKITEFWKENF